MQIQSTENPNVQKFILDKPYFKEMKEYSDTSEALDFPLAGTLLQFPFVKTVLTSGDFIAIMKTDEVKWEMVNDSLVELIEEEMKSFEDKPKLRPIEVYVETTPNPNAIKLATNAFLFDGMAEAESEEDTKDFPIAKWLLEFPYIARVFVSDNYISLTKTEDSDWQMHMLEIRDLVAHYLRQGKPIVNDSYVPKNKEAVKIETALFTDIEKQIQSILTEYIKPAVAGDGGNIDLVSFDEDSKTAKMLLQGACSGCPSSTATLKNGIERILKEMLPGKVENVEAVNA